MAAVNTELVAREREYASIATQNLAKSFLQMAIETSGDAPLAQTAPCSTQKCVQPHFET